MQSIDGTRRGLPGVKCGDSRELREKDHVAAWAFGIASRQEPGTITRAWVAETLKRSESWVTRNWNVSPYNYPEEESEQRALSQESKEVIREILSRPKKMSVRDIQTAVDKKRKKVHSWSSVYRFLKEEKARDFHVVSSPKITKLNRENRLSFCDYLRNWDENDFLHLAPSDEFFVYAERKPNHQNDRIWALSLEDIAYEDRVKGKSKYPKCIGIFLCFTAKKMMWVIKEKGESWDGTYFRKILLDNVIPFLQNPTNVLSVGQTTFLHDKAPCMKALATQQILITNDIDFFDNSQWPGSSPDLNAAENVGAILKDRTEEELLKYEPGERGKASTLAQALDDVLKEMENDTDLFQHLLCSYPARLAEVKKQHGRATKY